MGIVLENQPSFDFRNIKSLALVGSSGCILDNEYGELIDQHYVVMRFNAARVEGYEKYVGSKTTIRVMNGHCFAGTSDPVRFEKNDPKFISSLFGEHFFIKGYNLQEFHRGVLSVLNKNYINFLHNDFVGRCHQELGKGPSVGFVGLMMALTCAEQISCFGFDHGEISDDRRHYWEAVRNADNWKTGQGHSFDKEKEYFKNLEQQGRIKIYR